MVQPNLDRICQCDQCTLQGRRPQGSMQSHTAAQSHKIDQHIRSFAGTATTNVENATLQQTLRGIDMIEDPLWRGSSSGAPAGRAWHDGRDQSTSGAQLPTSKQKFAFPSHLVFNHPPSTLTDMYPGPSEPEWTKGPSGLRIDQLVNSPILLYMKHLMAMRNHYSDKSKREKVDKQVSRLESFRYREWVKQQRSCSDPGLLLEHTGILYDSGSFPQIHSYLLSD